MNNLFSDELVSRLLAAVWEVFPTYPFQSQNDEARWLMRWESRNGRQPENSSSTAFANAPAPVSALIRDGFRVRKAVFDLPQDCTYLKAEAKRALTICNLFVNHQLGISQIARVLDENIGRIVQVLIRYGLIQDRRVKDARWPLDLEKRKSSPKVTGRE
jgi:hypothetical protein